MSDNPGNPPRPEGLESLEYLGSARDMLPRILEMIGHSSFFEDFTREDVAALCDHLSTYQAKAGQEIIREGDRDDFMLLVISGSVNIVKVDSHGDVRPMSIVQAGATLGEMSMIDGEPRFASCIAIDKTLIAVLTRDQMVNLILNNTNLGAKILIKLVTQLSQRLRSTSNQLIQFMERTNAV